MKTQNDYAKLAKEQGYTPADIRFAALEVLHKSFFTPKWELANGVGREKVIAEYDMLRRLGQSPKWRKAIMDATNTIDKCDDLHFTINQTVLQLGWNVK